MVLFGGVFLFVYFILVCGWGFLPLARKKPNYFALS